MFNLFTNIEMEILEFHCKVFRNLHNNLNYCSNFSFFMFIYLITSPKPIIQVIIFQFLNFLLFVLVNLP